MLRLLTPDLYIKSVFGLNPEKLRRNNIEGLIIDIDNTLVPREIKYATEKIKQWLLSLRREGFKVCLISNNTKNRVVAFSNELGLPAIHMALKPRTSAFKKAMKTIGTTADNTAVIGDQIFTDVLGGNRTGLFTILVVPIGEKEFWWTTFVRKIENHVLRIISKNKKIYKFRFTNFASFLKLNH